MNTDFGCLPTMTGSLPLADGKEACVLVGEYLVDIPCWPMLARRSFKETTNVQHMEGFPGLIVDTKQKKIFVDRKQDMSGALTDFYTAYLVNDYDKYPISADYAAGMHAFLNLDNLTPRAVKGQLVGPVTWGMTVTDEEGRPVIYDETLGDVIPKFLRLKASWQEAQLARISNNTIIFISEPYLSAFGSVGFNLNKDQVLRQLDEVLTGMNGLKGIHCCGNTDWSIIMETNVDIISFDAYSFAQSLSLYAAEVKQFLARGGAIAWGIVPNTAELLVKESVNSLRERLEQAMAPFTLQGVNFQELISKGLLTPSCGLGLLANEQLARMALELLVGLSSEMRRRYL